jgi:rubrerythrin
MGFEQLQHIAVDAIKTNALQLAHHSPSAQAYVLTEYLWIEEGSEATALHRTASGEPAPWLAKLIAAQLDDERRHASLLRARLAELGTEPRDPPALVRAKLWWIERACAPYLKAFAAGPIVVLLAVAARLEATGVRMFARHLAVLDDLDATAVMLREIISDERRHAKSCAAAANRMVRDSERPAFEELSAKIAEIDRSFGVTLAVTQWVLVAALATRDRMKGARS